MNYIKTERAQQRGYSPAVITEGGRIVWLAGQTGTVDESGKSLAGGQKQHRPVLERCAFLVTFLVLG